MSAKNWKALGLTLACFAAGYFFYKVNKGDWINSIAFTVGILGILLSYLRNSNNS